jgi:hypothetical protein
MLQVQSNGDAGIENRDQMVRPGSSKITDLDS